MCLALLARPQHHWLKYFQREVTLSLNLDDLTIEGLQI